eukprot:CAMPEP_0174260202 /NCGR_PEP_ID=MMETSP0439-20130205/9218_1 /TAXON_ID=0 /ORGANISM="Stereomyxa ramosa, Strain Chinc5" /LENGTH=367 /DNA_ID=CAMNT_0015344395 /DNA_START=313 /DNA_END=1416 /DNA_ORIENTATION=+
MRSIFDGCETDTALASGAMTLRGIFDELLEKYTFFHDVHPGEPRHGHYNVKESWRIGCVISRPPVPVDTLKQLTEDLASIEAEMGLLRDEEPLTDYPTFQPFSFDTTLHSDNQFPIFSELCDLDLSWSPCEDPWSEDKGLDSDDSPPQSPMLTSDSVKPPTHTLGSSDKSTKKRKRISSVSAPLPVPVRATRTITPRKLNLPKRTNVRVRKKTKRRTKKMPDISKEDLLTLITTKLPRECLRGIVKIIDPTLKEEQYDNDLEFDMHSMSDETLFELQVYVNNCLAGTVKKNTKRREATTTKRRSKPRKTRQRKKQKSNDDDFVLRIPDTHPKYGYKYHGVDLTQVFKTTKVVRLVKTKEDTSVDVLS